ncbi:MAG TPA: YciI family protein [Vicinamibacterales bacterium]|nr:YciI family protein [Vicinamibacterales bacterium]
MMFSLLLAATVLAVPAGTQDTPQEMTTYQMVFLKKGPTPPPSAPADQKKMQDEHLANLAELNRKRINLVYGPIRAENPDGLEGIAVLDVSSADAAKAHFAADPFVKAGIMTVEVRPWMGPKGWFQPPVGDDVTNAGNLEPLIFGFLMRGPNTSQDSATAQEIQKGHLAYMSSLNKQGKLVMAGPFMDSGAARGVVVYRVKDVAEAKALAADDPAVKAGRLVLEAYPWMTLKGILK